MIPPNDVSFGKVIYGISKDISELSKSSHALSRCMGRLGCQNFPSENDGRSDEGDRLRTCAASIKALQMSSISGHENDDIECAIIWSIRYQ